MSSENDRATVTRNTYKNVTNLDMYFVRRVDPKTYGHADHNTAHPSRWRSLIIIIIIIITIIITIIIIILIKNVLI